MHPFRFISGLLVFKSISCSVRVWLLPKTCPCKMNSGEWTLWWVNGRRMWKGLLWRRWGETWWKLGMGDVERRKDDTFFLSPLSSNPLWFVDCSALRDFHWLFFLVVSLSNCVPPTDILTCVRACYVWLGRMNLAQVRGTFTQPLVLSCVEATRSKAEVLDDAPFMMHKGWWAPLLPTYKPPICVLYSISSPLLSSSSHYLLSLLYFQYHCLSTGFSININLTQSPLNLQNKQINQPTNRASKQPTNQLTNSQSYWSWDTLLPSKLNFSEKSY